MIFLFSMRFKYNSEFSYSIAAFFLSKFKFKVWVCILFISTKSCLVVVSVIALAKSIGFSPNLIKATSSISLCFSLTLSLINTASPTNFCCFFLRYKSNSVLASLTSSLNAVSNNPVSCSFSLFNSPSMSSLNSPLTYKSAYFAWSFNVKSLTRLTPSPIVGSSSFNPNLSVSNKSSIKSILSLVS